MNFLAHLFLSCEQESLVVGNFLADFLDNRDVPNFSAPIIEGIILHRKIDSYTDNHPAVRRGLRYLYPHHGKYASVVMDVLYDYFLAKNWELYSDQTLPAFAARIYEVLLRHVEIMPALVQKRLRAMVADNWLMNYTTYDGLDTTFARLQRRASKPALLERATATLSLWENELDREFQLFFPDVIAYVQEQYLC